jgi:hypothetical protein
MIGTMRDVPFRPGRRRERASGRAVLVYATVWLVAAAAAVALVLAVFGDDDPDTVAVPPVRETELGVAAGQSRCVLVTARAGQRVNPPVDGPSGGRPAKAGFYEQPVATDQLTAAVRKGIVVIQFRAGLDEKLVEALKALQSAFPEGTIVAPNATRMRFELAVVAYRRLLGCPRFTDQALDAVQLFRGRFLGSGPESA